MYVVGSKDFRHEIDGLKSLAEKIKKLGDEAADLNNKSIEVLQIEDSKDFPGQFYGSTLHDFVRDVEARKMAAAKTPANKK